MYSVLIVDDEKYVRLWIKNCIDWTQNGFNIVGEASDGYDALVKISTLKPNLVISDMDMPKIDGMKLMKKSREIYPDILFVILSGYNEFEYMRSAVKYDAVDYLLKPVKAEEIISVINVVKSKLEHSKEKREEELQTNIVIKENLELQKEKFFLNLLDEQVFTLQETLEKTKKLDIQKNGDSYSTMCIRFDEGAVNSHMKDYMGTDLCIYSITNIANEVFSANEIVSNFVVRKDEIVCIINFYMKGIDYYSRIVDVCRQVLDNINHYLKLSVSIGIGSVVEDMLYIGVSYIEAKRSLELRMLYGNNCVLSFLNTPKTFNREILSVIDESNLINSILNLDFELCKKIITDIFCETKKIDTLNIETIKMIYYLLISIILKTIYETGITPYKMGFNEVAMFTAIKSFNSIDQIIEKLLYYLKIVMEYISNTQNIKNTAVEKSKRFIIENFKEDISLTDIANHVHITPNYFCSLFKAETNQNLFDYITNLRIEKAKDLMKDDSLKTYEIGEIVGYKEPKYFSRVFKKVTGSSPSNYRKSLL